MPVYCLKCPQCGHKTEVVRSNHKFTQNCEKCGSPMKRNYSSECAISTFHPTVDIYAKGRNFG